MNSTGASTSCGITTILVPYSCFLNLRASYRFSNFSMFITYGLVRILVYAKAFGVSPGRQVATSRISELEIIDIHVLQ